MGKVINATTIGNLISAHMEGDEQKFLSFANFIADAYEEAGNDRSARIIRKRIDGSYKNEPSVVLDNCQKNVQTVPVNRSWKAGERLTGYKEEEVSETANEIVMHFIHWYGLSTYSGLLYSIARDMIRESYCEESRESGHLTTTISSTKSAAEATQLLDEVEKVLQEKCEELTERQEKKEEEEYEHE